MHSFVESKSRKGPSPAPLGFWKLFWIGFIIINGITLFFVPIGTYFSFNSFVAILGLVFLPVFMLGVLYSQKFGYIIMIACFLSIPGGAIGSLFLSDYLGFIRGTIFLKLPVPEDSIFHPYAKAFQWEQAIPISRFQYLWKDPSQSRQNVVIEVVPLSGSPLKKSPFSIWLVCQSKENASCMNFKEHVLRLPEDSEVGYSLAIQAANKNFQLEQSKTLQLYHPITDANQYFQKKGIYSGMSILILNFLWIISLLISNSFSRRKV